MNSTEKRRLVFSSLSDSRRTLGLWQIGGSALVLKVSSRRGAYALENRRASKKLEDVA